MRDCPELDLLSAGILFREKEREEEVERGNKERKGKKKNKKEGFKVSSLLLPTSQICFVPPLGIEYF